MKIAITIGPLLIVAGSDAKAANTHLTIVENGQARAMIVLSSDPAPCAVVGAREFRDHVKLISGATLETVRTDEWPRQAKLTDDLAPIFVGRSRAAAMRGVSADGLPAEGFRIRCTDQYLAIVGCDGATYGPNYRFMTDSAGTLYGVYCLLEQLGVRWFYPSELGTVVPKLRAVRVKVQSLQDAPFFHYRHTTYGDFVWGRRTSAGGDRDVWSTRHTCSIHLAKRYHKTNPEWFLRNADGKPGQQADLAHPEVVAAIADMAAKRFDTKPLAGLKYYLVIPHDGRARADDGARSEWVGSAVRQVADRVREPHSDGTIVYCAYNDYRLPPKNLASMPENTAVLIALSRGELLDAERRARAYDLIRDWQSRQPKSVYFCRYNGSRLKLVPALIPHVIAEDIKRLKALSVEGPVRIGGEMNFVGVAGKSPFSWWEHLNEYVTAKLLWDPDRDVDRILDDFCHRFFGPAEGPMRRFLDLCEQAYLRPSERDLFEVGTIDQLDALLREADRIAASGPQAARVAFFQQGFEPLRKLRRKLESAAKPAPAPSANALVRHYTFSEGQGATTRDGITGKLARIEGAEWADGLDGSVLRFRRPGSVVRIEPLSFADIDYSIEAVVKLDTLTKGRHFILGPYVWDRQLLLLDVGLPTNVGAQAWLVLKHRERSAGRNIALRSAPVELVRGQWYHVVGTFSRTGGMSLYLDGRLVGFDLNLTTAAGFSAYYVGASGNGGTADPSDVYCGFAGAIDDLRIHSRELTYAEVKRRGAEVSAGR